MFDVHSPLFVSLKQANTDFHASVAKTFAKYYLYLHLKAMEMCLNKESTILNACLAAVSGLWLAQKQIYVGCPSCRN